MNHLLDNSASLAQLLSQKKTKNKKKQIQWYTAITVLNSNSHLFSATVYCHRYSGCLGDSAPPILFVTQARETEARQGMVLMQEFKSSQRDEEKTLMPPKTHIWNSCSASSGQSICHMAKTKPNEV